MPPSQTPCCPAAEMSTKEHPVATQDIDDDEDPPTLSSHALEALKQFLSEQDRAVVAAAEEEEEEKEVALLKENWNLSQFWYERETAETVAAEVHALCTSSSVDNGSPSVACISCPTLFAYLKKLHPELPVHLLEYDKRFEQYGSEFTFYDYNQPEELPSSMKHAYRIVVADPPYLSKECLEKVAKTVSFLMQPEDPYLLLLTGDIQRERAAELLGLRPCGFRPQHSSKLGNEFRLFSNYDPGMRLGGWEHPQ